MGASMIYFDNCATTPVDPMAAAELARVATECFGNPSSIHSAGRCAAEVLQQARDTLAQSLHASSREIILTSSGTEANNFVIRSVVEHFAPYGRVHIVTSQIEHPSIYKRLEYEAQRRPGQVEVTFVGVDSFGRLRIDELRAAIREDTRLLTVIHCNNETGVLQDLHTLSALRLAFPRLLLHLDIVQSYTKFLFDVRTLPVDFLTVSGHKVYAPKGIGFVYVREGTPVEPLIVGGAQEFYRRAGTENVPAAAALARAVQLAPPHSELLERFRRFERLFFDALQNEGVDFHLNGPSDYERRMPGIFNLAFERIPNKEDLLIGCDLEGLMISSTSACHSGVVADSRVLKAMGVPEALRRGAVRIAFNKYHTEHDVVRGAEILARCVKRIQGSA
ncbi:Cysteine desulfurase [Candidatus Sumerlaea chitinivorans]|uniref:cysteine desulfurase n=1 Tax=Sumerlaea chitinivorans TaxID=2250252 RepID=A0A2Z4Y7Q0_SUMC1|nr:Cysteine desulfurase [Candidatus Sumerlaea chitinivorans]